MLVAACLGAGVDFDWLCAELARLDVGKPELLIESVRRQGIAGTRFVVRPDHVEHAVRHLTDIERIVAQAGFGSVIEKRIVEVFRVIGEAEAKVHRIAVEKVHFHEVGAVDSIIDVCAAVLAFDALGVQKLYCSEIVVGNGYVNCEHGLLPVPSPATINILEGLPIRRGRLEGERVTPTGAALLRCLVDEFQATVSFRPLRSGYGAGSRDEAPVPNLLRLTIGEVEDLRGQDKICELSLQVDNVSGEVLAHALDLAMAGGALDVYVVPAITKKNRPAHLLTVLCSIALAEDMERLLLTELPSLGLRRMLVERRTLARRVEERDTDLGPLRFKIRTLPDGTELAHPEADDVQRLAKELGLPLPVVLARIGHGV